MLLTLFSSIYREDKAYPQEWLENTLIGLISKEDEFCATRRSAGLPFMLQAILESQPVVESELFRYSIGIVLKQCINDREENDTIRTHCLNILRALFRHNKLGSTLDYLTTEMFHVAHLALNSSNFAVSPFINYACTRLPVVPAVVIQAFCYKYKFVNFQTRSFVSDIYF